MICEVANIMCQELLNTGNLKWFNLTDYVASVFRLFLTIESKVILK